MRYKQQSISRLNWIFRLFGMLLGALGLLVVLAITLKAERARNTILEASNNELTSTHLIILEVDESCASQLLGSDRMIVELQHDK